MFMESENQYYVLSIHYCQDLGTIKDRFEGGSAYVCH